MQCFLVGRLAEPQTLPKEYSSAESVRNDTIIFYAYIACLRAVQNRTHRIGNCGGVKVPPDGESPLGHSKARLEGRVRVGAAI